MKNLKDWLEFSIENQEGLKIEQGKLPFPEWNKGYLEALSDMKKIIDENEKFETDYTHAQRIGEMWRTK